MKPDPFSDEHVLACWQENAAAWCAAVREGRIGSRRRVTDAAIVAAVLACAPRSVLDIGCGEGWLARALAAHGLAVTGVDAVPALIDRARLAGGGRFRVATYADIAAGGLDAVADVAVCNFSLIGDDSVADLLAAVPRLLNPGGRLVIQTLHPHASAGEGPCEDGWRAGSWQGCGPGFSAPAPWYFRTLGGWVRLLADSGLQLAELREPVDPEDGRPASIILVARRGPAQPP